MNTLQQVSGAIGTAVAITIMSASQTRYLDELPDPESSLVNSLTAGVQSAFIFGLTLAIAGLVMSFFIKSSRNLKIYKIDHSRWCLEKRRRCSLGTES